MKCPRCGSDTVRPLVKAPRDDAWEVFLCATCYYSYRDTEPEDRKDPALYDERFRIDPADIPGMDVIPPIAKPLKKP